MNVLVFDIETIPDVEGGRRLNDLSDDIADEDVARVMSTKRREKTGGSEFLPCHQQKIVAISAVRRSRDEFKVATFGEADSSEADIIRSFYKVIEKYTPTLVSWNGSGFDLPVLHYRSLINGVDASRYWDMGEDDRDMKWDNYIQRYHWRHTDLMDVLAGFNPRSAAPLDEIATMLGFPGKLGMDGSKVWDTWLEGGINDIREYCETDVLNTWLVYLAFEKMRGRLSDTEYNAEIKLVRNTLTEQGKPHLNQFLAAWPS